jgi:uncharacterized protein (DUF1499 family)
MKVLLVVIVLIVLMVGYMIFQNNKMPSLGLDNGNLKPLGAKPNGVSSQVEGEKSVDAIPFAGDLETSKKLIKKACEQYGSAKIEEEATNYLHLVFTTGKMKYKDDVEFYFDETSKMIEYRSESRVGYSDMGLNKERYEAIVKIYNALKEAN